MKIKLDGVVKVLDFGLAKTGGTPTVSSDNSPTLTIAQTEAGVILGTASCMSPEQAKGKPVDKRADIYSYGVVLYEMLAGRRLHRGESITEVLASVIKEEPHWEKIPTPVQPLLRRCLEKDPKQRLHDIADARLWLEEGSGPAGAPVQPRSGRAAWVAAAVFLVLAAISTPFALQHFREKAPVLEPIRSSFQSEVPHPLFNLTTANQGDMTADGKRVLLAIPQGSASPSPITVVLNRQAALRK